MVENSNNTVVGDERSESICVPGGGFPGFWFTYGQLQSAKEVASSHSLQCYSSGCLCVVAFLADLPVLGLLGVATDIQAQWQSGLITRFEVVPRFIDQLIDLIVSEKHGSNNAEWLAPLRVITGRRHPEGWGLIPTTRSPDIEKDAWVQSLRQLLLQTTWIPGATANDLFLDDHIDGGFVSGQVWNQCGSTIEAVYTWEILWHCFNANLSKDQAIYFYKAGLENGRSASSSSGGTS